MKKTLITMIAVLTVSITMGQKSKELKIQAEMLAKLKLQSIIVKEKNKIDQEGLDNIGNNKNGTYSLYNDYFKSLRTINSSVKESDKAQYIRDVISEIKRFFPLTISRADNSGLYERSEIAYLRQVYDKVVKDCNEIIRNLNAVTNNGEYEMSDDQRMERIDDLHAQMVRTYMFSRKFCTDIENVKRAREQSKQDAQRIQQLYGLDKNIHKKY